MPRCYYDEILVEMLKHVPGHVYITEDGKKLYALANDTDVLEFTGPDFSNMTDDDINKYIVDSLSKIKL